MAWYILQMVAQSTWNIFMSFSTTETVLYSGTNNSLPLPMVTISTDYFRGKPKFFIVQSCRGDRPDAGVESCLDESNQASPSKHQAKKRRNESLDAIACAG